MTYTIDNLLDLTQDLDAARLLRLVLPLFGDGIALATSGGAEDQVLIDMAAKIEPKVRIFTLDTGRLPAETFDVLDATRRRYGVPIKVLLPDSAQVEAMVAEHGVNLFRESVELRKQCCYVRKVVPLHRELETLDAWITGLRRGQAVTRRTVDRIEWDGSNGLVKINPLADWTARQVWDYIERYDVPVNALHAKGHPSIGCACCTRATEPGEDIRAGRWWWEQPEHKECGLHLVDGRLVPVRE